MANQSVTYQVVDLLNQCAHSLDTEHNSKSSWTSHKQQKFLEQFVTEKFDYYPGVKSICIYEFKVDSNLTGHITAFMYPHTVDEAEVHRQQWGENPPLYGFLRLEMKNGKSEIQVSYPNEEQVKYTADISVTSPAVADRQNYSPLENEKPKTFVDFVINLGNECGWQVHRTEYDDYAIMTFSKNNREENIDITYQSKDGEANIITFCSSEVPAGDDSVIESFLDNHFLERNMATYPGSWGVIEIDDQKHYVYIVKMEISKIKVKDFRLAISTIINERQNFYDFMGANQ